jgi:hypothetical protein
MGPNAQFCLQGSNIQIDVRLLTTDKFAGMQPLLAGMGKVKLSPQQGVEAQRVVRRRGSHIS